MKRFKDEFTQQIFETRFAEGVPKHVSVEAHEMLRILNAARSLQDVGVLGPILRWPNMPDRRGLHVHGKWHITFGWSDDFGPREMALERR